FFSGAENCLQRKNLLKTPTCAEIDSYQGNVIQLHNSQLYLDYNKFLARTRK
ncbi:hypothetical protein K443DRAFT_104326, partial [Laccaria amethystina LaAM-08-1]